MHVTPLCQRLLRLSCWLLSLSTFASQADPDPELVYKLKASVVKVHVATKSGGRGVGTGVVVAQDKVATNCHILAQASGVHISKFGDSISPVKMQADWAHDICLLEFQYLNLPAVNLRPSAQLAYGEPVFSIGFPGGPPKPQTRVGKVRAIYPLQDSVIVRTDATFSMGASGSPLFDQSGTLVGLTTFKSPGRYAYYYSLPVEWVTRLLQKPEGDVSQTTPFWDQPLEKRPYLMQVVQPYMSGDWPALLAVAQQWTDSEPANAEGWFYQASALHGQGMLEMAKAAYQRCLSLRPEHSDGWSGLAMLAKQLGENELQRRAELQLKSLDEQAWLEYQQRMKDDAQVSRPSLVRP